MISTIAPRPIAWISTVSKEGIYNIAPFSFYMGISSSPPLIAVSIGKKDNERKKKILGKILKKQESLL